MRITMYRNTVLYYRFNMTIIEQKPSFQITKVSNFRHDTAKVFQLLDNKSYMVFELQLVIDFYTQILNICLVI